MKKFFTSESVTEGHPDKVCDQIADGILDAILKQDPEARAAIECCAAYDGLLIMGEVTTSAKVDMRLARGKLLRESATISDRFLTIPVKSRCPYTNNPPTSRWA